MRRQPSMAKNIRLYTAKISILLLILCVAAVSLAAPVKHVAVIDRSLWPDSLSTRAEFDRASRAENILFLKALLTLQEQHQDFLTLLEVKSINQQSLEQWSEKTFDLILQNIFVARKSCYDQEDLGCKPAMIRRNNIKEYAEQLVNTIPPRYTTWSNAALEFYRAYGIEQLRLAALFPATTSEILTLSDQEKTGLEWNDLEFLLTFDDGPTLKGGITDHVCSTLIKEDLHGIFFVLRDPFQARIETTSPKEVQALYKDQCVGIHGSVHKPHPKMNNWKESIDSSLIQVNTLFKEKAIPMFFRPPYGQRTKEMINYLKDRNVSILLWNIDSQDWHSQISKERMADRVLTLMLLWRRGIVLFHDTHAKTLTAIPDIIKRTKTVGIQWKDCRTL